MSQKGVLINNAAAVGDGRCKRYISGIIKRINAVELVCTNYIYRTCTFIYVLVVYKSFVL